MAGGRKIISGGRKILSGGRKIIRDGRKIQVAVLCNTFSFSETYCTCQVAPMGLHSFPTHTHDEIQTVLRKVHSNAFVYLFYPLNVLPFNKGINVW